MIFVRSRRARRSRKLLLFFVIVQITAAVACLYRWGGALWEGFGRNLSLYLYNGVIDLYVPGLICVQQEGERGILSDLTEAFYPALAANEKILWYESQTEQFAGYENLAAKENEEVRQMLAENRQEEQAPSESGADSEGVQETQGGEAPVQEAAETEPSVRDTEAAPIVAEQKKTMVDREKLKDFDYLLEHFYQVDGTTEIGSRRLNAEKLLSYDLRLNEKAQGAQILIYHTHSQEGFIDSVPKDPSMTVVGLGDRLTELLTEKGYRVIHNTGTYDLPTRDRAYSVAAPYIQQILEDNPDIEVVIDLHRDGVSDDLHLVSEQNGKQMAKLMFFNGLSHTKAAGDIDYLKNPYIEDNLAFSLQMQIAAEEYYPKLTRRIYLKGYRFNMHFVPKCLLVEVGAQTNTVEEAMNAMEPLADILDKVLSGKN